MKLKKRKEDKQVIIWSILYWLSKPKCYVQKLKQDKREREWGSSRFNQRGIN